MLTRVKSLFLLIAVSLLAGVGGAQFGSPAKEPEHARATLIADVTQIEPGKPFRLGIRYTMDPKWHIYWINPGDTGLRTKIDWVLPEGFTVGALHWPAPSRYELGGLVSYAYGDEVVLFAEVTPPANLDGEVTLKANSSWLVCDEICVPGRASLEMTLSVGPAQPSPEAALIERYAAQTPGGYFAGRGTPTGPSPVQVTFEPSNPVLTPGETTRFQVTLTPQDGKVFDISKSNDDAPAGLFPFVSDDFGTEDPRLIEQTPERIVFEWPVEVRSQAPPGTESTLHAAFRFSLAGEAAVAAAELSVRTAGEAQAAAAAPAGTPPQAPAPPAADSSAPSALPPADGPVFSFLSAGPVAQEQSSLLYYLLLAFVGGLILNVMPCVLPVISLKVMSFVRQSAESPRRRINLGLMFGVGVLASFAALAVATIAVTASGAQAGWGFQMTEPRFVLALAAVVLAFALSLFGVYSVELPGSTANAVARGAQGEGYGGAFMNGVLATLLATPCTAPFLAPAAAFLLKEPAPIVLLFFLTVGAGLAAPYVILAMNPRLLKWLPKPGRWMETMKQLMGFALVATLVWLLWVLGSQLGNDVLLYVMVWLMLIALGCWILGLTVTRRGRQAGWLVALALVAGGYGLVERAMRPVDAGETIAWEPFSVSRVEELAAAGQTMFIDFTADWCVTCKANERLVLETDPVRAALAENKVVALKGDWTNGDPEISRVLETFGSSGVPLYLVIPGGAPEKTVVLPPALTRDLVVRELEAAATVRRVAAR